jgi:hypothetical protein
LRFVQQASLSTFLAFMPCVRCHAAPWVVGCMVPLLALLEAAVAAHTRGVSTLCLWLLVVHMLCLCISISTLIVPEVEAHTTQLWHKCCRSSATTQPCAMQDTFSGACQAARISVIRLQTLTIAMGWSALLAVTLCGVQPSAGVVCSVFACGVG